VGSKANKQIQKRFRSHFGSRHLEQIASTTDTMSSAPCQALMNTETVTIQEQVNVLEAATAIVGTQIQFANKYKILDVEGRQIFFAAEETSLMKRQLKMFCPTCAPWKVGIALTDETNEKAFIVDRPCTCTICCWNRPVANISDASGTPLGTIQDPFLCCNYMFTVKDPSENDVLYVDGGCCQLGFCCPFPCEPCDKVIFDIKDKDSESLGSITRTVPGCLKFIFAPSVDNYTVDFSRVQQPDHRALLIVTSLLIDFEYFSRNANNSTGGGLAACLLSAATS